MKTPLLLTAALLALPGNHRILSDYAGLPHALAGTGLTVVPVWSPEVAWLFDDKTPPDAVAHHWRQSRLRYIVTSPSQPFLDFLNRHARGSTPLFASTVVWQNILKM